MQKPVNSLSKRCNISGSWKAASPFLVRCTSARIVRMSASDKSPNITPSAPLASAEPRRRGHLIAHSAASFARSLSTSARQRCWEPPVASACVQSAPSACCRATWADFTRAAKALRTAGVWASRRARPSSVRPSVLSRASRACKVVSSGSSSAFAGDLAPASPPLPAASALGLEVVLLGVRTSWAAAAAVSGMIHSVATASAEEASGTVSHSSPFVSTTPRRLCNFAASSGSIMVAC
mmetsp:Transcript_123727/g.309249  ORF Transcript_123727/g.309249 Transcript_123727/m.309249 type:complete len:237 (+) Transcript_123727:2319-3029(+)